MPWSPNNYRSRRITVPTTFGTNLPQARHSTGPKRVAPKERYTLPRYTSPPDVGRATHSARRHSMSDMHHPPQQPDNAGQSSTQAETTWVFPTSTAETFDTFLSFPTQPEDYYNHFHSYRYHGWNDNRHHNHYHHPSQHPYHRQTPSGVNDSGSDSGLNAVWGLGEIGSVAASTSADEHVYHPTEQSCDSDKQKHDSDEKDIDRLEPFPFDAADDER